MLRGYRVQVKESRVRHESNMKLLILYGVYGHVYTRRRYIGMLTRLWKRVSEDLSHCRGILHNLCYLSVTKTSKPQNPVPEAINRTKTT